MGERNTMHQAATKTENCDARQGHEVMGKNDTNKRVKNGRLLILEPIRCPQKLTWKYKKKVFFTR